MTEEEYVSRLMAFVREEILPADQAAGFTDTFPLMESGVLDSLRVALLLTHIRDELHVHVSPALMDTDHFKDVRTIARMLHELSAAGQKEARA
ncbi:MULTISPECIES: hypothetical protein [unclassified Streptomyces]|uniref:hypothetical protein n=1 Tax=unclassified Streptomyces TaxID=2593676 RepID=UPI0004BF7D6A|nr:MULTISPECIES: hypothetical protein [unclassified Streptomyces]KOX05161.1 hypothetical protein ADL04_06550 [Streptomyces sp. NRRL B-3648]